MQLIYKIEEEGLIWVFSIQGGLGLHCRHFPIKAQLCFIRNLIEISIMFQNGNKNNIASLGRQTETEI